jgi:hypothetical protein
VEADHPVGTPRRAAALLAGRLTRIECAWVYLNLFNKDDTRWETPDYEVLQRLFSALDLYDSDPALGRTVSEVELRHDATAVLQRFRPKAAPS